MCNRASYNFSIAQGGLASPSSSLDDLNAVVEFEDVSNSIPPSNGPSVIIKVIDREAVGE
jgi:hypothetical protein